MLKLFKLSFTLYLTLISSGVYASDNSEPIVQLGLNVFYPSGGNWTLFKRTQSYIAFAKDGENKGESYVAVASLYRIPKFKNKEEYSEFVKKGRSSNRDTTRFEVITNNEIISEKNKALCVKHNSSSKDKKANYEGEEADYLVLDVIGYNCRHPFNETVGVNFELTHRHFVETKDANFKNIAELYIEKLEFTKF